MVLGNVGILYEAAWNWWSDCWVLQDGAPVELAALTTQL